MTTRKLVTAAADNGEPSAQVLLQAAGRPCARRAHPVSSVTQGDEHELFTPASLLFLDGETEAGRSGGPGRLAPGFLGRPAFPERLLQTRLTCLGACWVPVALRFLSPAWSPHTLGDPAP